MSGQEHDFVFADEIVELTPAQFEEFKRLQAAMEGRRRGEVILFMAGRGWGRSASFDAMVQALVPHAEPEAPKQMSYGPPKKGKRGKLKRW